MKGSFLGTRLDLFDLLPFLLLGFALLHDLGVQLLERVRYGLGQLEQKHHLVFPHLVQQTPSHTIRNPVVAKIVLGNRLVLPHYLDHLLLDLLLNRLPNVLL